MSEMVEKVARAMHAADRVKMAAAWEDTSEGDKWAYLAMARAAIKSMREPTAAMYRAAYRDECDVAAVYRAMIDAVLKE